MDDGNAPVRVGAGLTPRSHPALNITKSFGGARSGAPGASEQVDVVFGRGCILRVCCQVRRSQIGGVDSGYVPAGHVCQQHTRGH